MRFHPTPTEAALWHELRASQLGVRFKRQVVIGNAIVDVIAPVSHEFLRQEELPAGSMRLIDAERSVDLYWGFGSREISSAHDTCLGLIGGSEIYTQNWLTLSISTTLFLGTDISGVRLCVGMDHRLN